MPMLDPALGAVDLRPEHRDEDQQHEKEGRAEQRQPPGPFARSASKCRSSPARRPRSRPAGGRNNRARRSCTDAARIALRRGRARRRRRRSARCRSAPRPAAAARGRSPRTSGRAASGPSGRSGSGSTSAALALSLPEMLPIITPPPTRGTGRRAPRNRETGRTTRRPARAAPYRPACASARPRCTAASSVSHSSTGMCGDKQPREQFARLADGIG